MESLLDFDLGSENLSSYATNLKNRGFLHIHGAIPSDFCRKIVEHIDYYLDTENGEHESGYMGSMQRIWAAENTTNLLEEFKKKSAHILSAICAEKVKARQILAMRDQTIGFESDDEREKFSKGRWHIDSWRDQYKVFLFLDDVGLENGPFEFVFGGDAHYKKRLLLTRPWWFFNPLTHFFTGKRPYQSIADDRINYLLNNGFEIKTVTASQGSILIVNPSALIHRARPISSGKRYLSVAYF